MPDSNPVEYTVDVRYGSGSLPAEPYAARSLPNCSHPGDATALVNSHATLAFGNQLRWFFNPKVDEPSLRAATVKCNWSWASNVPCPKNDRSYMLDSASIGGSRLAV